MPVRSLVENVPSKTPKRTKPRAIKRTLSRDELAGELDLHPDTIKRHHTRSNPPPHDRDGQRCLYSAEEYLAWMDDEGLDGERGRPTDTSSPDLDAAKLRKENALADRYEIMVAKERGVLCDRAAYKTEWVTRVSAAKNKLIGMASQLAPQLYGQDVPTIERIVSERVEQIIRELQQGD